jgi:DNA mismatch repair protein MutS
MIIDEYLDYTARYKAKYGVKCVVLMQVGSFFEMYSIKDDITEDIYNIADICNIQISRKNKSTLEVSISNPLMAGFPCHSLNKFTTILLNNNYTIVLIEQVTEPPNPKREIREILSPGHNLNISNKKNNYMIVLYYEYISQFAIAGIAGIDLTTGKTFVYEAASSKADPQFMQDEVYRIISTYNPCEMVIICDKKYDEVQKNSLIYNLNLANILVHYKWENYEYLSSMTDISYQTAILEKSFAHKKCLLSIIETLNLEKYYHSRIALCCLLQFAYEHNKDIIRQLNIPEIINDNVYLNIEYNSAIQLNILPLYANDRPLLDILNRCCTAFGARMFKERLLKPLIDINILNERYYHIEHLLQNERFKAVHRRLNGILDLERIKRKMLLGKFNPQDWQGFDASLCNAIEILQSFYAELYKEDIANYKNIIEFYKDSLDLNEASKYNLNEIKGNIFIHGKHIDIDNLVQDFQAAYNIIVDINNKINLLDDNDATSCKIEYSDKDGYYLTMTKRRYDTAKCKNSTMMQNFQVKSLNTSNNVKLVSRELVEASETMECKQQQISKLVLELYQAFVKDFITKFGDDIDRLICTITEIDIACCNAKNAYEYKYYKPSLVTDTYSYINAENVRHPIIERIDDNVAYVGNDVNLSIKDKNGMLLYGINAAGKSSLMKSVGINVIMAQAGMYVACQNMKLSPYKHIFTRICGMDNIYKGMSSFTVEMTELRNILQRCDKYSLVLGDEICNGTEFTSALAIVTAGIDSLVKKQASFIFATHLHDLTELDTVKAHIDKYILVQHMHITIEHEKIIYDRKLRDGKGLSTYGVEVCKALDMPRDFMIVAENVRKDVEGHTKLLVNLSKSRYNKNVYMTECYICKGAADDTHHIEYQCNSDDKGYFNAYHQNSKHNLLPLCKSCHNREHNGDISIKGFVKTSTGIEVHIEENVNPIYNEKTVITDDEYNKIKLYVKRGKCDWYLRNTKNTAYKKCTDETKIQKKISSILQRNVILEDISYNSIFDPMF